MLVFVFVLKMCTLNISNLISSYELKLSAHNKFLEEGTTGPILSK